MQYSLARLKQAVWPWLKQAFYGPHHANNQPSSAQISFALMLVILMEWNALSQAPTTTSPVLAHAQIHTQGNEQHSQQVQSDMQQQQESSGVGVQQDGGMKGFHSAGEVRLQWL